MDRFVYLHGFNSGPGNRSGNELEQRLQQPIIRPQCDYSLPYAECLADIRRKILEKINPRIDRVCLMGTSLGGFYSLNLRLPCLCHVMAWNPVIYPAAQVAHFTGKNTRFTDGVEWEFSREALLSYAGAPDPRPWLNAVWQEERRLAAEREEKEAPFLALQGGGRITLAPSADASDIAGLTPGQIEAATPPQRDIFFGTHDELLNSELGKAYWKGYATLHDIDSGHSIEDFSHAEGLLTKGLVLESFDAWRAGDAWAKEFGEAGFFAMAGIVSVKGREAELRRMMWEFDQSYLEMQGTGKDGAETLFAVFFHPRHEGRERRLLRGLAMHCGGKRYALLSADGRAVTHVCGKNIVMDSETRAAIPNGRSFAGAVQALFKGWKGSSAHWQGHELHGSWMTAMMRGHFDAMLDRYEDPVAKRVSMEQARGKD